MSTTNQDQQHMNNTKYTHQFRWESSVPERVSIRGSFDQWQSSLELRKHPSGKFSAPIQLEFGSKISYKVSKISLPYYVVDGTWQHNPNEPTETDPNGNVNNVLQVPQRPSFPLNPETEFAQSVPNPAASLSSRVLDQGSDMGTSSCADPSKTTQSAELPTLPEMSIAFPSASPDNVPELTPRPKQPSNPKRTFSLFAPGGRFGRASHRTQSLATAPGTPTEKASPAGASVSNVVSAMAGVAATAIPAAILAVTGKDITRASKADSTDTSSPAASPIPTDQTSVTPEALAEVTKHQRPDASPQAGVAPDQAPHQPADQPTSPTPEPLVPLPVNDATENPEPEDCQPKVIPSTHQLLSPSTADTTPETAEPPMKPEPTTNISTPSAQPESPASELPADPTTSTSDPTLKPPAQDIAPSVNPLQEEPSSGAPVPGPSTGGLLLNVSSFEAEAGTTSPVQPALPEASGSAQAAPQVKLSPKPIVPGITPTEGASDLLDPKSKPAELTRKTNGWRYSVGSIRSRRASGEQDRRSASLNPPVAKAPSPESPAHELQESSPKTKRKSSLFHKIKTALSPHKKNEYSTGSGKRNSLTRTTTVNRE
ncbi:hypothetical protein VP01_626g12 [Puccinia sorghi]|uniref:AMP-activated protein kinase glycogen-binding domain-containing protein n=1 Tax=Puccinia sorghi TaxID=27349 RepID=A0A0L6UGG1_9BASI|nr:hypothetical protein VP01_626g12 [Puccinia sorghi]